MENYISDLVFMFLVVTSAISIAAVTWVVRGTASVEADYCPYQ